MSKQLTSVRLPHPKGDPRMRKFVVLNLQWWKKLRSAERDWCAVCCRGMDQHNQIAFTSPFRVLCVFQPPHNGIRLSDDLYRSESDLDFGFLPNSMAIAIPLDWNCIWVAKCLKIVITTPIPLITIVSFWYSINLRMSGCCLRWNFLGFDVCDDDSCVRFSLPVSGKIYIEIPITAGTATE